MQYFDVENKVWAPKPPLDGKVDFVVPKVGIPCGFRLCCCFSANAAMQLRLLGRHDTRLLCVVAVLLAGISLLLCVHFKM